MKDNFEDTEQLIQDEFLKDAQETEKLVEDESISLSEDRKEYMKNHIDEQIKQREREQAYEKLSEKDREALELGRAMQNKKVLYRKKSWKMYVGFAAVLVMVLGIGATSFGGPERIIKMFTKKVGEREVSKINSAKDTARSAEELEEEAYQKIKDELQIEPVRIIERPNGMKFDSLEYDSKLQTAELIYAYENKYVIYYINMLFNDSSGGKDIEDEEINKWEESIRGCTILVKEYEEPQREEKRYSAEFEFNGVKYLLVSTMDKEDFYEILNNLFFFQK